MSLPSSPSAAMNNFDLIKYPELMPDLASLQEPILMQREMGAKLMTLTLAAKSKGKTKTISGTRFLVFAPNASQVSVIGDFNHWQEQHHKMQNIGHGIWGIFIADITAGERYKFALLDSQGQSLPHKADPWGQHAEQHPSFASLVYDSGQYQWQDKQWQQRPITAKHEQALAFYELHIGSWRRDEDGEFLNYRQLAEQLIPYLLELNYTHVELMPVAEHPFYGSWGYQPVGLFAPTSRFGSPDDFKYFVDQCHQAGLGVIMDWVPAHFPADDHGLAFFDGSPLFHDPDPRRGWHQDWQSYIYDYRQPHVQQFLIANALYWLEQFHIDGIRVDAVASMLYLDYSRNEGEWLPNHDGGNHNYDAIELFKKLNESVYQNFPNAMTIAEESTSFTGVSKPTYLGGLGFGFKWNMGWMHDSLRYMQEDPINRKYHHQQLTFPLVYAFSENYVLSLSHDEVVYGKGSMLGKMPGDDWQRFANLRAYMGYTHGQPGKKLSFMGSEFAQQREWAHDGQIDWELLNNSAHQGIQKLTADLNQIYQDHSALHQLDCSPNGFEWRLMNESEQSILAHERLDTNGERILVISNFTPIPRTDLRIGIPESGTYELLLNSDDSCYGGSQFPIPQQLTTENISNHEQAQSLLCQVPPLATVFYKLS